MPRRKSYRSDLQSIYTQNMLGIKTDTGLDELIGYSQVRNAFAVCGQETWRCGNEEFVRDGYTFVGSAPAQQHGRGSMGVCIVLSPRAEAARQRAGGSKPVARSPDGRSIAVRLVVRGGSRGKQFSRMMGILLVSGYAPTSAHSAAKIDAYYEGLAQLIALRQPGDVLVLCADANASIGRGSLGCDGERAGAVGPFGLQHLNDAGRRLRSFMEVHQLCSLASFYRKQYYGTWIHPCSRLPHQLDHIIVSREDRRRFTDCGSCPFQLVNSDHRAGCRMQVVASIRRKADQRSKLLGRCHSSLYTEGGRRDNADVVVQRLAPRIPVLRRQRRPTRLSLRRWRQRRSRCCRPAAPRATRCSQRRAQCAPQPAFL